MDRARLENKALKLFVAEGYDAVSVDRIRQVANISNGSFFHAFANKSELAAELLVACVKDYQDYMLARIDRDRSADDGIETIVSGYLHWVHENQLKARFMVDQGRSEWFALAAERIAKLNRNFNQRIETWRQPHVDSGALVAVSGDVFLALAIGPAQTICRMWLSGLKRDRKSVLHYEADLVAAAKRALVGDRHRSGKAKR
jgi:AcrR family transcriptional regulator